MIIFYAVTCGISTADLNISFMKLASVNRREEQCVSKTSGVSGVYRTNVRGLWKVAKGYGRDRNESDCHSTVLLMENLYLGFKLEPPQPHP